MTTAFESRPRVAGILPGASLLFGSACCVAPVAARWRGRFMVIRRATRFVVAAGWAVGALLAVCDGVGHAESVEARHLLYGGLIRHQKPLRELPPGAKSLIPEECRDQEAMYRSLKAVAPIADDMLLMELTYNALEQCVRQSSAAQNIRIGDINDLLDNPQRSGVNCAALRARVPNDREMAIPPFWVAEVMKIIQLYCDDPPLGDPENTTPGSQLTGPVSGPLPGAPQQPSPAPPGLLGGATPPVLPPAPLPPVPVGPAAATPSASPTPGASACPSGQKPFVCQYFQITACTTPGCGTAMTTVPIWQTFCRPESQRAQAEKDCKALNGTLETQPTIAVPNVKAPSSPLKVTGLKQQVTPAASPKAEPAICEELRSKLIDARHRYDQAQQALWSHPTSPEPQKDAAYIRLQQARDQIKDEEVAYFDLLMLAGCSEIAPPEPKPQDANQTPAAPQTTTTAAGEDCDSLLSLFRMTSAQLNGEEQRYNAVLNSPGNARRPEVRQAAARVINTRKTLRLILNKMTRAGCSTIPTMPPAGLMPDPDPDPEPGPSQAQPDPSLPKPQRTRQADCEIMRGKARAVLNSALQIENLINYSALMQLYADIYRLLILGDCETDDLPKADPPTRRAGPAAPTPSCDDLLAAFGNVERQLHDAEAVFERDRLSVDPTTQVIAGEAYGNIRARRGELEIIRRNMQQASCTYLPGLPPSQWAGTTPLGTRGTNFGSNPTPAPPPVGPGLLGGSTPRVPPGPPPAPPPPGLLGGATPPALPPVTLPPIKLGSPPGPITAALPPINLPPPKVTPPSPPPATPATAPPDDFVTHTLSQPFTPGGFCPNKSAFEACKFGPKDTSGKPSEGWVGCVDPRDENFACKGSGAKPNCSCTQDRTGKVPPRDQLIAMAPKAKKHTPLPPVALPQITLPEPGPMVHPQPPFIPPYSGPAATGPMVHTGKPRINIYTPTHTPRVNVHTPIHTPRINIYRPSHTPRINVFRPSHTPRVNVFRHSGGHTTGRRRH